MYINGSAELPNETTKRYTASEEQESSEVKMVKNTNNQDNSNLTRDAIRKREVKAAETDEQREVRKAKDRERKARKRAEKRQADEGGASERKRLAESDNENHRVVIPRLGDAVEELTDQLENTHLPPIDFNVQLIVRRERNAIRMRLARANETTEASDHRRKLDAQRRAGTRSQETIDEANQRQNRNRRNAEEVESTANMTPEEIRRLRARQKARRAKRRVKQLKKFEGLGLPNPPEMDVASINAFLDIGKMDQACTYCGALLFMDEPNGLCCDNGKVRLPPMPPVPPTLDLLLFQQIVQEVHPPIQLSISNDEL
ncbi:hypothetical protein AC1031_003407 [Aphanomyces cochlioides]|nr:hypothetical protein AC1031_003407 [Aphanomyces cochlioides]